MNFEVHFKVMVNKLGLQGEQFKIHAGYRSAWLLTKFSVD